MGGFAFYAGPTNLALHSTSLCMVPPANLGRLGTALKRIRHASVCSFDRLGFNLVRAFSDATFIENPPAPGPRFMRTGSAEPRLHQAAAAPRRCFVAGPREMNTVSAGCPASPQRVLRVLLSTPFCLAWGFVSLAGPYSPGPMGSTMPVLTPWALVPAAARESNLLVAGSISLRSRMTRLAAKPAPASADRVYIGDWLSCTSHLGSASTLSLCICFPVHYHQRLAACRYRRSFPS
ncbi:hypothetical protein BS50DRAFT_269594 [Corynespora cassiicola Philippines]|uniref:Uncharacterized protein n=1 Tax=Corynespora cassiicola Philippines TaxID=1448308 RepID=A0A2T2P0M7_CORCC|nr:hypothetical protein BS50DRAFT_269594 [Corynespora cassiicola Philippines]